MEKSIEEVKIFEYFSGGGFVDERGLTQISFGILDCHGLLCDFCVVIGDLHINKRFTNETCSLLETFWKKIKEIDLNKLETDLSKFMMSDLGIIRIKFGVDYDSLKEVNHPNCMGLKHMCDDFVDVLLKDSEIQSSIRSLLDAKPEQIKQDLITILDCDIEFSEEKDYNLSEFKNVDISELTENQTLNKEKKVSSSEEYDKLLKEIDKRLKELDN